MTKLEQNEIEEALQGLNGWRQQGDEINKEFSFADFSLAMEFVNHVAGAAQAVEHHPDIDIRYDKVKLALSTHSEGGLTKKDVELARKIEEMLA